MEFKYTLNKNDIALTIIGMYAAHKITTSILSYSYRKYHHMKYITMSLLNNIETTSHSLSSISSSLQNIEHNTCELSRECNNVIRSFITNQNREYFVKCLELIMSNKSIQDVINSVTSLITKNLQSLNSHSNTESHTNLQTNIRPGDHSDMFGDNHTNGSPI